MRKRNDCAGSLHNVGVYSLQEHHDNLHRMDKRVWSKRKKIAYVTNFW